MTIIYHQELKKNSMNVGMHDPDHILTFLHFLSLSTTACLLVAQDFTIHFIESTYVEHYCFLVSLITYSAQLGAEGNQARGPRGKPPLGLEQ